MPLPWPTTLVVFSSSDSTAVLALLGPAEEEADADAISFFFLGARAFFGFNNASAVHGKNRDQSVW